VPQKQQGVQMKAHRTRWLHIRQNGTRHHRIINT